MPFHHASSVPELGSILAEVAFMEKDPTSLLRYLNQHLVPNKCVSTPSHPLPPSHDDNDPSCLTSQEAACTHPDLDVLPSQVLSPESNSILSELYLRRGLAYVACANHAVAVNDMTRSILLMSNSSTSRVYAERILHRGMAYYHWGRYVQAIRDMKLCTSLVECDPYVYFNIGLLYRRMRCSRPYEYWMNAAHLRDTQHPRIAANLWMSRVIHSIETLDQFLFVSHFCSWENESKEDTSNEITLDAKIRTFRFIISSFIARRCQCLCRDPSEQPPPSAKVQHERFSGAVQSVCKEVFLFLCRSFCTGSASDEKVQEQNWNVFCGSLHAIRDTMAPKHRTLRSRRSLHSLFPTLSSSSPLFPQALEMIAEILERHSVLPSFMTVLCVPPEIAAIQPPPKFENLEKTVQEEWFTHWVSYVSSKLMDPCAPHLVPAQNK